MSKSTIDLTAYRTPELAARVGNALGANLLGQVARSAAIWLVIITTINLGFVWALFPAQTNAMLAGEATPWLYQVVALPVAVFNVAATTAGVTLIRAAAIMQGNVMSLVGILFDVSGTAYKDMKAVTRGDQELPSATQVMQHAYDDVLLPLVRERVGWASSLGVWLLNASVGSAVRKTSHTPADELSNGTAEPDRKSNDGPEESTPGDSIAVSPPHKPLDGAEAPAAPEVKEAEGAVRRNLRRIGWAMALLHTSVTAAACFAGAMSGLLPLGIVRLILSSSN